MKEILKEKLVSEGEWQELKEEEKLKDCCHHHGEGCCKRTSKRDMEKEVLDREMLIRTLSKKTHTITHEALRRYFVRLTQYGYYDYKSVYRLLALVMLNNFREEFSAFWNKKDEKIIEKVLSCLYCSICAIPMPNEISETELTITGKTKQDYVNYYDNEFKGFYSDL